MQWLLLILAVVVAVIIGWLMLGNGDGPKVLNLGEAGPLRPPLLDFMTWWNAHGPFVGRIATNAPPYDKVAAPGGFRDDAAQAQAFALGLSKARIALKTAHGHAAGLDFWPAEFDPRIPWEKQSMVIKSKFCLYGAIAVAKGFQWGGDWETFKDYPHIQIHGWERLPVGPYAG